MTTLAKATLVAISPDETPKVKGTPFEVQFNPTTMKLTMTNSIDVGSARGREAARHLETSATTLSLDLVFDTADEASDKGEAVNVRDRSKEVSRFVLPAKDGRKKQAPPRVRFAWGTFVFDGVMSQLTEDIDLFSPTGVPLRSKVTISIKEQNPEYIAGRLGPAAATGADAKPPGEGNGAPGNIGGGGDATGVALGGESAADFAARMGLDPAAWRGLAAGLDATLSLEAGLEIDFSTGLSLSAGVGVRGGAELGASASLQAAIGLEDSAAAAPGFALSAAGGVRAAVETVEIARTASAATEARAAFAPARAPAPPARPGSPSQPRPALVTHGLPTPAAQAQARSAPPPPLADPRATSFGFGVALRPTIAGAALDRSAPTRGWIQVRARERDPATVPEARDPTRPPWEALPLTPPRRAGAHRGNSACGCGGAHRGDFGCGGGGCGGRH
jgi:Contractile injection system tube protein